MTCYLTDKEINELIERIHELSNADKIVMERSIGLYIMDANSKIKFMFFSIFPQSAMERIKNNPESLELYQIVFFITGVMCRQIRQKQKEKEIEEKAAENVLAELCNRKENENGYKKLISLMDEKSGAHSCLYRHMDNLILQSKKHVDCYKLIKDLQDWNAPDARVQKKWAMAYALINNEKKEN